MKIVDPDGPDRGDPCLDLAMILAAHDVNSRPELARARGGPCLD